jgi:hypothetical protein
MSKRVLSESAIRRGLCSICLRQPVSKTARRKSMGIPALSGRKVKICDSCLARNPRMKPKEGNWKLVNERVD